MPLLFYGHKFVARKDYFIFDILLFYIVIIFSQLSFNYVLILEPICYLAQYLSCLGLFIVFGSYMVLTLMPLKNFIFKDPITNKYGFKGHSEEFSVVHKKDRR